jgi:hypothetical protein
MLHLNSVSKELFGLLQKLCTVPFLANFSLGGGTSLALRFGHRSSVDIDLFSSTPFDSEMCRDAIYGLFPKAEVVNRTPGSLCLLIHGIKTDILVHLYPLLFESAIEEGIPFLSLADIAAMKINAVTNRGSKKDFSDLLLLHKQGISLSKSLDFFSAKYGSAGRFLAVKSLAWFEDAEQEPDPIYLNGWTWKHVREEMTSLWRPVFESK